MSNTLEEVLNTFSENEIIDLYHTFRENKEDIAAFKLRTAFIEHRLFSGVDFDWSGAMKFFILSERDDLEDRKYELLKMSVDGSTGILTNMNTFLQEKLRVNNALDISVEMILKYSNKELWVLEEKSLPHLFRITLLHHYTGRSIEFSSVKLMLETGKKYEGLKMLALNHRDEISTSIMENKVEELLEEAKNSPNMKSEAYQGLREQMRALFIHHLSKGNTLSAKYFLISLIQITDETDSLYNMQRFMNKELFD